MTKDAPPQFDPDDWEPWSFRMEHHLRARRAWGAINHYSDDWANQNHLEHNQARAKAFNEILKALGSSHSSLARPYNDPRDLWDHLFDEYRQDDAPGRMDLTEEFTAFKYAEGETVNNYLLRFDNITNRLANAGIPADPNTRFLKLMDSLPTSMEAIKNIMITNGNDDIHHARRLLRRHQRRLMSGGASLLKISKKRIHSKEKGKAPCNYCRNNDHARPDCPARRADEKLGYFLPHRDAPWRAVMEESISKRIHKAVEDFAAKTKRKHEQYNEKTGKLHFTKKPTQPSDSDSETEDDENDENLNCISDAYDEIEGFSFHVLTDKIENSLLAVKSERWLLDTGASAHVTGDLSILQNPVETRKNFSTGNSSSPIVATQVGSVVFKNKNNGKTTQVDHVYYSAETKINVLSIQCFLGACNASAKFSKDECVILQKGIKLMHAKLESDRLYCITSHEAISENKVLSLSYYKDINFWHNLLGHLHPKAIIEMSRHNLVDGMPTDLTMENWTPCPICASGKSTKRPRKKHPKYAMPPKLATLPGDSCHSDQKGPITPISIHGNRYSILFIDEHTGYVEIYHLSSLDQTAKVYNTHKQRVKTLFNRNIKRFICDGHTTYKVLADSIESDGGTIQFRAPYDPNGNAIAERTIRTIFEMARTMINHAGLPQNRWEEAVDHAVWIRNRVKTARLNNMTPFEAYFKVKPDIRHLHPFGCLAHALIPKDTRDRVFDPITRRCIFVGFSKRFNAFRLFDIEQKKEVNSRDVLFFDDTFPLNKETFTKQIPETQEPPNRKDNPNTDMNISRKSLRSYAPNMESRETYNNMPNTNVPLPTPVETGHLDIRG
jgi:hypothetical protein